MNEEEIGLTPQRPPAGQQPTPGPMQRHDDVSPPPQALTNEQLVDFVLTAPEERLIPWESCKLPSRGFYYGWPVDSIEVRGMGQVAEKVLANQRLAQTGESIDHLFDFCCRFPEGFDSHDLLLGDRTFLLFYLRGITHGNIYEFAVTCQNPNCNTASTHTYDFNQLANTIVWAKEELGSEPFKVQLPYMTEKMAREFWVEVRFLRGHDLNNIMTMRRAKKRAFAAPAVRAGRRQQQQRQQQPVVLDDTMAENLEAQIVSVLGVKDRHKIGAFVRKMHATDAAAVRDWLRENTPGIDAIVTITCPECGTEFLTELPITESFFRPTPAK